MVMRAGLLVLGGLLAAGCGPAPEQPAPTRPPEPVASAAPPPPPASAHAPAEPEEVPDRPAEPGDEDESAWRAAVMRGYAPTPRDAVTAAQETPLIAELRAGVEAAWKHAPPRGCFWIEHPTTGQPWLKDTGFNSDWEFSWRDYDRHWRYGWLAIEVGGQRATIRLPEDNAQRGAVIHFLGELGVKVVGKTTR